VELFDFGKQYITPVFTVSRKAFNWIRYLERRFCNSYVSFSI